MKGYKYERFESISSTNDYAKLKRLAKENLIIIAESQTGGRGTKGRSFSSNKGGLYLSVLTFYDNFPADRAFEMMQNYAAAVCETLTFFGVKPQIKWPNDILTGGKKICGILIENTFLGKFISSSIVGLGLNIFNQLPEELMQIATTLQRETGKSYSVKEVEEKLLYYLEKGVGEKYGSYLGFIGESITLLSGDKTLRAKMIGVDDKGNLLAEVDGEVRVYASAEVRIFIGQ